MFHSMRHGFVPSRGLPRRDPEGHPTNTGTPDPQTPPWGSDEEFNPEKAWNLIQNLKTDKSNLQTRLDGITTEKDAEIAGLQTQLTEKTNSLIELEGKVSTLEATVGEKDEDLTKTQALVKKHQLLSSAGLDLDYADQVVGDDEAAWTASVGKLQKLAGTSTVQRTADPVQVADGNGKDPAPTDEDLARSIFGVK